MTEALLERDLVPGELSLPAFCLETGYTLAEVRNSPAWFIEGQMLILQKQAITHKKQESKRNR